MFLLVFVRHVGAHSDRHQHGVSKQTSINLGKFISSDTSYMKCSYDPNLGEGPGIIYLPPFICQIVVFTGLLNGFDFYFESRDTEKLLVFLC